MRELGNQYGALIPEGIALECGTNGNTYSWSWDCKRYDCLTDVPQGIQIIPLSEQVEKPHQLHQEPFNCCSQWAVRGEEGTSIKPRPLPDVLIPDLCFGYPKGKEKALRLNKNGNVISMSLTSTRRMSEETAKIFDSLF